MELIKNRITKIEPWQRTLYILFFAQMMVAVGFASIFPFLPFYVEQLGSSTGLSIELLSGLVFSAQSLYDDDRFPYVGCNRRPVWA